MKTRRPALVAGVMLTLLAAAAFALRAPLRQAAPSLVDGLNTLRAQPIRLARALRGRDHPVFANVAVSQVGYGPYMRKRFTAAHSFSAFSLVDASGTVVFRGSGPAQQLETTVLGSIRTVWIGDFTDLVTQGRFTIVTDRGDTSHAFEIGTDVFRAAIRPVQRALYFQRAFTAIEPRFAEGPWIHPDDSGKAPPGVRGGWHDAGDFSIYNLTAGASVFWLLSAATDFRPTADDTNIPESGNGVPDLLDEVRWELEWLLSVQDRSGGFRNATCEMGTGPYGTNTPDNVSPYVNGEVGTMATARAVAVLAFAATVFPPYDPVFAARALDAARKGWTYLEDRPHEHSDGPTCPAYRQDGDATFGRHVRMFAAAGMLLATDEPRFHDSFEANYVELTDDPSCYRTNVYAALLYLRAPAGSPARKRAIEAQLRARADVLRQEAAQHPFEWAGRYHWGSLAAGFERASSASAYFCRATQVPALPDCEQAAAAVHYALGRNSLQLAYVNGVPGVTRSRTRAFHHWLATLEATPYLFPGTVGAGPNEQPDPQDRSVPQARPISMWGYWDDPAMPRDASTPLDARFTDNDSFSTNEIAVVWQASALYDLYLADWLARLPR